MKQPVPFFIVAATGVNAFAYWAKPEDASDDVEPLVLLRVCSFVEMLYGCHLHAIAELMCTIIEVTRTKLYIMQRGQFKLIRPEDESMEKVAYHEIFFPYSDMLLLMMQMHY